MDPPKLYSELSSWWYLLSTPEDYAEEAAFYWRVLEEASLRPIETLLELGSGGGNNASHMKAFAELTLVDLSEGMLAQSRGLNPECRHFQGDMRSVRLDQMFDAVFVHDAIDYITTLEELKSVIETVYLHCREGGAVLLAPDHVVELFEPSTDNGGHDGPERSMRYLEWIWDPDPNDSVCVTDFAFMLREADGTVRVEHDRHFHGLFSRDAWLRLLTEAGFQAKSLPLVHSEMEPGNVEVFIGVRPTTGVADQRLKRSR